MEYIRDSKLYPTVRYSELSQGDLFYFDDKLWLKLDTDNLGNAAELNTGVVLGFDDYDLVGTVSYSALRFKVDGLD